MRRNKNNPWVMNLIWLAGLVLVIFTRNYFNQNVLWRLTTPDDAILYAWLQFALPFLTGLYLSLLFMWNNFRMKDTSLFFMVALPALIIAVLNPLAVTFPLPLPDNIYWFVTTLNSENYLTLVAGLTLIPSRTY